MQSIRIFSMWNLDYIVNNNKNYKSEIKSRKNSNNK